MEHTYAVIFNGPPNSGKDTFCDALEEQESFVHHNRFKTKLFELTKAIYNISDYDFFQIYNNRELKEVPMDIFYGRSAREAMIYVSEDVIKPNFGKDYFGEIAAQNMTKGGLNVFSDGGFEEELWPVYKATDGRMIIIQLHRYGCSFKNDSRNYIDGFLGVPVYKVHNNEESSIVLKKIKEIIEYEFDIEWWD